MIRGLKLPVGVFTLLITIAITILLIPTDLTISALQHPTKSDVLLIDPGHGGIDSGAEGQGGVCEKHINLTIGLIIRQMAEADGWKVVMTRTEDKGLYPEKDRQSIRSLKTADLMERRKIIEETQPIAAISIHLNSFKQDPGVRGAQTFYPSQGDKMVLEKSKALAECVQEQLVEGINDGTDRVSLSKNDVLIFKNPIAPIIIVECGFLSNPQEEALLNTKEYQEKIAECIYLGIMKYSGKARKAPVQIIDNRG